jgi:Tfp pilus assembly protein PilE
MKTRYIIILVVCVIAGVGIMQYRKQSQENDILERNKKEHARITEIAKTSPKAGLAEMGRLLEKYYSENNSYPNKLEELYPKYLANKSLIEEVNWEYKPGKDNFMLKKVIVADGERLVAAIDKGLKPRKEEAIIVAETEKAASSIQKSISDMALAHVYADKGKRGELPVASVIEPEFALIKETEIEPGFEYDISYKCLVWKDDKGVLGFGNVQYPRSTRFSIYNDGKRYDLKRFPYVRGKASVSDKETVTLKRDIDSVAAGQNKEYLMWKNQNGALGFGNIQYPGNKDTVSINAEGTWQKVGN